MGSKKKTIAILLSALMLVLVTGCNKVTEAPSEPEPTESMVTIEPNGQKEENAKEVVVYGDTIQVCWEMQEKDAWIHIDPTTAGQHAILEIGKELEFIVKDSTTTIEGIYFDVSECFVANVINQVLGKKVGDMVIYEEELDGRKYEHTFTITGINDVQIPSFCFPQDWNYQLKVSQVGNFFLANGQEADNGPHYGFVDKVTGCGPIWGEDMMKFYTNTTASSILIPQGNGQFTYSPTYVTTNDRSCTWSEGVEGYGITEEIEIRQMYLGKNKDVLTFDQLCIVNGYAENETKWKENNRIKTLNLYYCDVLMGLITLEDTMKPQYIDLTPLQMKVGNGREAVFHFQIAEVYEGSKYDDTCITGIEIGFTE